MKEILEYRKNSTLGALAFENGDKDKIASIKERINNTKMLGFVTICERVKTYKDSKKRVAFFIYSLIGGDDFLEFLLRLVDEFGAIKCAYAKSDGSWKIYQKCQEIRNLNIKILNKKGAIEPQNFSKLLYALSDKNEREKANSFSYFKMGSLKENSILESKNHWFLESKWQVGDSKSVTKSRAILIRATPNQNLLNFLKNQKEILGIFEKIHGKDEIILVANGDFLLGSLAEFVSPNYKKFAFVELDTMGCAYYAPNFREVGDKNA